MKPFSNNLEFDILFFILKAFKPVANLLRSGCPSTGPGCATLREIQNNKQKQPVEPSVQQLKPGRKWVMQLDNDSKHTSNL